MAKMSSPQLLMRLLKDPGITDDWGSGDFTEVSELAVFFQIEPIIFSLLKNRNAPLPLEQYSELKHQYLHSLAKNITFWQDFLTINRVFAERKIPMVPLKGMDILTRFYPSFETRMMVDVDILIKEKQYEEAVAALQKLGYEKRLDGLKESYWRNKHCHVKFYKEPVCVEVHWGLDCKRGPIPLLPHLWERIQQRKVQDQPISILSNEDALFSYALHLRRFSGSVPLKQVFDVARIINETEYFSWDYVLNESARCHMQATVFFLLTQVAIYTNARIPNGIMKGLRIPQWQKNAIRRLIAKHTFQIEFSAKLNYLKAHFLLYDTIIEPIWYIINIPYEQFCKFYDLPAYTKKSTFFYVSRFAYIPIKHILSYH